MTDTAHDIASERPAPRWMRYTLVASLALNLLIVGALGAAVWRFRFGPPGPIAMSAGSGTLLGFAASLPPERRMQIWHETAEHRHALRPLRSDLRQRREAIQAALVAEPFDAARFAAAQASALELEIRAREESQKLFLAIARRLSPDERAAFARWQQSEQATRDRIRGRMKRGERGERGSPRPDGKATTVTPPR